MCADPPGGEAEPLGRTEDAEVAARSYEIRIRGHVPPEELEEVENLRATVEPAETVLRGCVPDQAALHGILTRLHSLGLELLEVRRVPVSDEIRREGR